MKECDRGDVVDVGASRSAVNCFEHQMKLTSTSTQPREAAQISGSVLTPYLRIF